MSVLAVACPVCGAVPGDRCFDLRVKVRLGDKRLTRKRSPHKARGSKPRGDVASGATLTG